MAGILCITGGACKKLQPANDIPPDAAVNLFNASQVIQATGPFDQKKIYVDGYDTTGSQYVYFNYQSGRPLEYPVETLAPGTVPGIPYMRLQAGSHEFTFTNAAKFKAGDISSDFPAGTLHQLYLADGIPASDSLATYNVLRVEEDRRQPAGKVRVRFVHLSPDAGNFKMYRMDANNNRLFSGLPAEITYGAASPYAELDTAGAINQRLVLHYFQGADTLSSLLSTSVPAEPGTSYVIVINGFKGKHAIKNPTGRSQSGTVEYETINFEATLAGYVRRSY
ncbi:DUF4397 domain-containing protein [Chitinophaga barathri]|nr:DUF4397 domain-containing protein [Chitinophaga barathri]